MRTRTRTSVPGGCCSTRRRRTSGTKTERTSQVWNCRIADRHRAVPGRDHVHDQVRGHLGERLGTGDRLQPRRALKGDGVEGAQGVRIVRVRCEAVLSASSGTAVRMTMPADTAPTAGWRGQARRRRERIPPGAHAAPPGRALA